MKFRSGGDWHFTIFFVNFRFLVLKSTLLTNTGRKKKNVFNHQFLFSHASKSQETANLKRKKILLPNKVKYNFILPEKIIPFKSYNLQEVKCILRTSKAAVEEHETSNTGDLI